MKVKRIFGIILCFIVILTSSIMVFAANSHGELLDKSNPESEKESKIVKDKNGAVEPLANLQVITEEKEIDKIVSERPDVKQYLEKNETLADLEIITDPEKIEDIWREQPLVKQLMEKNPEYKVAYVNNSDVKLRSNPSIDAEVNENLCADEWVLLNQKYSVNSKFLWWEVLESASGSEGWLVNDYSYLNISQIAGLSKTDTLRIDFETLKFIQ